IVPMRDLKDTVKIENMCSETKAPVFVTKNGYGKLVVMDIECFERLMNDVYEAKAINEGLKDLENDKTKDGNLVLNEIKAKYGF
ncbi:MAG: type II toxin-antitoxin system prevent-host-death family antitoxin, partial [Acholeplasmatales bacterium]|nr:type II toxin-antitoxin system prevent-host-death family antitoxin [Acholeplasmatales bacterium]